MDKNQKLSLWVAALNTFSGTLIWGIAIYLVFWRDVSPWWFLGAFVLTAIVHAEVEYDDGKKP